MSRGKSLFKEKLLTGIDGEVALKDFERHLCNFRISKKDCPKLIQELESEGIIQRIGRIKNIKLKLL